MSYLRLPEHGRLPLSALLQFSFLSCTVTPLAIPYLHYCRYEKPLLLQICRLLRGFTHPGTYFDASTEEIALYRYRTMLAGRW
jgi:hypothetical protein